MKTIEAVIFDMDGVIFDTEKIYLQVWKSVFKKYGYELNNEVYISVMGRGRKVVKERFCRVYGDKLPIEAMYKEKDKKLQKIIDEDRVPIKNGAIELLEFLNNNGYKVALATSAKRERVMRHLKAARIENKFHEIVCGDEINKPKPNPEIFNKAAESLNRKPEKCLVIEDSPAGLKAAFNANMKVINVPDLKAVDEEMKDHCHEVMENLVQVKEFIENLKIAN